MILKEICSIEPEGTLFKLKDIDEILVLFDARNIYTKLEATEQTSLTLMTLLLSQSTLEDEKKHIYYSE